MGIRFAKSQVDQVKGKEILVKSDDGGFTQGFYESKPANRPVNMHRVETFGKTHRTGKVSTRGESRVPNINYPVIEFIFDGGRTKCWFYPPNEEGARRRDADYDYLLYQHVKSCPIDDPAAKA